MEWPGSIAAGTVEDAVLVSRNAGSRRGTARLSSGEEALVDALPGSASEGACLRLVVTRAAIAEKGRLKRAQARVTDKPPRPAPNLAERLAGDGLAVRTVRRFPHDPWPDIILAAAEGTVEFGGGTLVLSPTPAMTLIDVDGALPPRALALAAVPAVARAIRQLDLAGSIGIDFPSLESRADRRAVDDALAAALSDWPHQSTAMNGFGFVQLVARLERPSILQRVTSDPAGAAARLLLRSAEAVEMPGALLLTASQAVRDKVLPDWEAQLIRRSAREIRWKVEQGLAPFGAFAQAVPS